MPQRVLFAGDSITKGQLGVGYVPLLVERFPKHTLVNLGQDGDTVLGIGGRTISHLKGDSNYDLLVIAAGHNDVILPAFKKRSPVFRAIARQLARRGSAPACDLDSFVSIYRSLLRSLQSWPRLGVVITTISCVNEKATSETAKARRMYNDGIRSLASEMNVGLADVGAAFDQVLAGRECRDYFLPRPLATAFFDTWKSRSAPGADALSAKRELHLTIDGVHLNSHGARIYADVISSLLIRDEW